jgi:hypothetical protein
MKTNSFSSVFCLLTSDSCIIKEVMPDPKVEHHLRMCDEAGSASVAFRACSPCRFCLNQPAAGDGAGCAAFFLS